MITITETMRASDDLRYERRHTAELSGAELAAVRALMGRVFEGDFSDHDWEHALGGVHALAFRGGELVGHASVVQRRVLHRGRALRCGYVEGVGVEGALRRRGVGSRLMDEIEGVIRRAYEVGFLAVTDDSDRLYARRGWLPWRGESGVVTPRGVEPTPDETEALRVLLVAGVELDLSGEIFCDFREGDPW